MSVYAVKAFWNTNRSCNRLSKSWWSMKELNISKREVEGLKMMRKNRREFIRLGVSAVSACAVSGGAALFGSTPNAGLGDF
jgi:hypothetical protein